jgi:hypothetical protein
MNQMPHPPYSPDIASSDFFLFADLKHTVQACSYDSADHIFSAITDLMENLEKSILHRVFMNGSHTFILSWRVMESTSKDSERILLITE